MSAYSLEVKRLECIPCTEMRVPQPFPTEADHCNEYGLAGKKRRGDKAQIPQCQWHHVGRLLPGWTRAQMTERYGPSMAVNQKDYRKCFGTDDEMLAITDQRRAQLLPATA